MNNLKLMRAFKRTIFIILFMSTGMAMAQLIPEPDPVTTVPGLVRESFQQKFPKAEPVWFRRYRGDYDQQLRFQGKFVQNDKTVMAIFNQTGELTAMVVEIDPKRIPKIARNYMHNNYPYNVITESAKITQVNKGVTYELGMYLANQYVIVIFDKEGNFIQLSKG